MKIELLAIGKTTQNFVEVGLNEYIKRLKHYASFSMEIIPDIRNTKNLSMEQIKEKEGDLLLKCFQSGDCIVLLDERGQNFTSAEFAAYIEKKSLTAPKRLLFVIGGSYGFSPEVYRAAQEQIALSKMTFSHQMIRLIFVEQLYRAFTILNNEPYHHA